MIIDGVEVLYTMRNGKIVDPNIPTDGLVCYLDARGKTNNDIYKNVLLDLSGNGNHGTLRNFNFTEESGYVKGLSGEGASGLKFDGVDDRVDLRSFLPTGHPRTCYAEIYLDKLPSEQKSLVNTANNGFLNIEHKFVVNGEFAITEIITNLKIGMNTMLLLSGGTSEDLRLFVNGTEYEFIIKPTSPIAMSHPLISAGGKRTLIKAVYWNRKLTEQEITKLMEV